MTVDPSESQPLFNGLDVSHALSEQIREEYAGTLSSLFSLISQLHQDELSEQEFQRLAHGANRALLARVEVLLAHSVGGWSYSPQRQSPAEQAFDPAPDL